jgi:hypothetical protein
MEAIVTITGLVAGFYVSIPVGNNFPTGGSADGAGMLISTAGAVVSNGTCGAQASSTNMLCTIYSSSVGTYNLIINFQYQVR